VHGFAFFILPPGTIIERSNSHPAWNSGISAFRYETLDFPYIPVLCCTVELFFFVPIFGVEFLRHLTKIMNAIVLAQHANRKLSFAKSNKSAMTAQRLRSRLIPNSRVHGNYTNAY
jgi:hypothetical protein